MTTKPTKGPWTIEQRHLPWDWRINAGAATICDLGLWSEEYRAEQHANARLISAAPNMLEALNDILTYANRQKDAAAWWPVKNVARAAIAKAEEEQS